jgi:hypothetical protein
MGHIRLAAVVTLFALIPSLSAADAPSSKTLICVATDGAAKAATCPDQTCRCEGGAIPTVAPVCGWGERSAGASADANRQRREAAVAKASLVDDRFDGRRFCAGASERPKRPKPSRRSAFSDFDYNSGNNPSAVSGASPGVQPPQL